MINKKVIIRLEANGSAGEFIKEFNDQKSGLTAAIDRNEKTGQWDLIFFKSSYRKNESNFKGLSRAWKGFTERFFSFWK